MKLISVALHGYKRFLERSSMNVDGKLVAIVGPNESGKTSFLKALTHLNHNELFEVSGPGRETTRNVAALSDQDIVEATYLLDDGDREALKDVHGGQEIRWCKIAKRVNDGRHHYTHTPYPRRSLQPRQKAVRSLNAVLSRQAFLRVDEGYGESDLAAEVRNLASTLDTDANTITSDALNEIQTVTATLENAVPDEGPTFLQQLTERLRALAEHETGIPARHAANVLSGRKPEFLLFSDEERLLRPEYNLDEVYEDPPAALRNLTHLAGLDLDALHSAITMNDYPEVASMEEQANDRLRARFYESWSQSRLAVRLRTEERILKVLIREEPVGEAQARFTGIEERSDGLRQFVSLAAFVESRRTTRAPILLIDEVETHLHYNAQADLVQTLTKQSIAEKVIYTTHSIGCLPEDLGTGVRLIAEQESTAFTSRIENAFWTSNRSGFSPLLFGMGASALAFIPLRHALIAEGPSDIILWPRLLREATGRTHLDLQVAPGLSKADRPGIIVLDQEAPRTAYLLDADQGGIDLRSELIRAGISTDRIFSVPDDEEQGLVVEDLIDARIYVQAVNEELHRSKGEEYTFPAARLPVAGRPTEVKAWCDENGINEPKKVAVAYRVIEAGVGTAISAQPYRETLAQLFLSITAALEA